MLKQLILSVMSAIYVILALPNISYAKYNEIIDVIEAKNFELAFQMLESLAQQNDIPAQLTLAKMYVQGRGTPIDYTKALVWRRRAAALGSPVALNYLGEAYWVGKSVSIDYYEAVKWFRLAAERGHLSAQFSLALALEEGKGVPKDKAESIKWLQRAAEQGFTYAQYIYGLKLQNGDGVGQDYSMAAFWFEEAGGGGNAAARGALGRLHHQGKGVPQDFGKAVDLILSAATSGEANAQAYAGRLFERGEGVEQNNADAYIFYSLAIINGYDAAIPLRKSLAAKFTDQELEKTKQRVEQVRAKLKNNNVPLLSQNDHFFHTLKRSPKGRRKLSPDRKMSWHMRELDSAEKGSASSQYFVATDLQSETFPLRNVELSIEWLKKSASQDYVSAQIHLAGQYECGYLVEKNRSKAIFYYQMAAKNGNELAQRKIDKLNGKVVQDHQEQQKLLSKINSMKEKHLVVPKSDEHRLGEIYYLGIGGPKNLKFAYQWFVRNEGDVESDFYLGRMYENGEYVAQDYGIARQIYLKVAAVGSKEAHLQLANIYDHGLGTNHDEKLAVEYYNQAADEGYAAAHFRLGQLYERGQGLAKNKAKAHMHYKLSYDLGDDGGAVNARRLTSDMSTEQIVEAKKQYADWKENYNEPRRCLRSWGRSYNAFVR